MHRGTLDRDDFKSVSERLTKRTKIPCTPRLTQRSKGRWCPSLEDAHAGTLPGRAKLAGFFAAAGKLRHHRDARNQRSMHWNGRCSHPLRGRDRSWASEVTAGKGKK